MTVCPRCTGALERRYRVEVISAAWSAWKLRITCTQCGATGLRDPIRDRWHFFDDMANGRGNGAAHPGRQRVQ